MPVVAEAGDVKRVLIKRGGIDSARCMEVHPKSCLHRQCDREKGDSDDVSLFRVLTKRLTRLRHVIPMGIELDRRPAIRLGDDAWGEKCK